MKLEEAETNRKLPSINRAEEEHWRLKSKSLWLQAGDMNTSCFHKHAKARQYRNNVKEIKISAGNKRSMGI